MAVTDFLNKEAEKKKLFSLDDNPEIAFKICSLCDDLQKWKYLKTMVERFKFDSELFLEYSDHCKFKHVYGFFGRAKKLER